MVNLQQTTAENSTTVLLRSIIVNVWKRTKYVAHQGIARARWMFVRAASTVAPQWVLKRASELFIKPQRFEAPALERRALARGVPFNVTFANGNIAAWRFGDHHAPAIICSHGWSGRGGQFRAFVDPLCSAGYQVVLFDHLGHGQGSGRRATLVDFWLGLEAVWMHLEHQNTPVAGLLGHSLGGAAVASSLRRSLLRKPSKQRLPKAILIAPPTSLIGFSKWFKRFTGISEAVRSAMQWRLEQKTGVKWQEFELPQSVNTIHADALFIHDANDEATPQSGSIALARAWPNAKFLGTEGLGHSRILRNKAVLKACVDFFDGSVQFALPPDAVLPPQIPAPLY